MIDTRSLGFGLGIAGCLIYPNGVLVEACFQSMIIQSLYDSSPPSTVRICGALILGLSILGNL
jgi:hypothetical protein